MSGAAPDGGEGWDMPDTVLGRKPLAARRPSAEQPAAPAPAEAARPVRAEAARPARDDAAEVPPRAGGKTLLLAVIVFVAVLLVGGLLVMLYLTSEA
jgi:cytochrome c-type biogenesis protein CcmH/NrfG